MNVKGVKTTVVNGVYVIWEVIQWSKFIQNVKKEPHFCVKTSDVGSKQARGLDGE